MLLRRILRIAVHIDHNFLSALFYIQLLFSHNFLSIFLSSESSCSCRHFCRFSSCLPLPFLCTKNQLNIKVTIVSQPDARSSYSCRSWQLHGPRAALDAGSRSCPGSADMSCDGVLAHEGAVVHDEVLLPRLALAATRDQLSTFMEEVHSLFDRRVWDWMWPFGLMYTVFEGFIDYLTHLSPASCVDYDW